MTSKIQFLIDGVLKWTESYSPYQFNGDPNVQALAQGETVTDTFQVRVTDEHGACDTRAVNVTVTGTNDAPVITGGVTTGAVQEDGVQSATGSLSATDVDHGATRSWTASACRSSWHTRWARRAGSACPITGVSAFPS